MAGIEDHFDNAHKGKSAGDLASSPVDALKGVTEADAEHLRAAFGIKTVQDLGTNKFFLWAQEVVQQVK